MSRFQWGVSLLLLYHLASVGIVALPSASKSRLTSPRHPQDDVLAATMTPILDVVASTLARAEARLLTLLEPVGRLTHVYEEAGIRQTWSMFAAPETDEQYLRINYFVSGLGQDRLSLVRELVLPAQRDDRVRLRHDFRDKAIVNAIDAFFARRDRSIGSEAASSARDDFAPIVRYFRSQYRHHFLTAGEDVIRTEVWYGLAPMPPRGRTLPEGRRSMRLDVLREYYNGPVRSTVGALKAQGLGSDEREADIVWTLEYVEPS